MIENSIVVAPATADFLAKLANGLCDDLLSTLCIARECPLMVAPAIPRLLPFGRRSPPAMVDREEQTRPTL